MYRAPSLFGLTVALTLLLTEGKKHHSKQDPQIEAFLKEYGDGLPVWLRNNFTMHNLEYFLTPAFLEVIKGDGVVQRRPVVPGYQFKPITAHHRHHRHHGKRHQGHHKRHHHGHHHGAHHKHGQQVEGIDPSIIVQIGKIIWNIINNNTPTVDYSIDWTGAVPENATSWIDLENFKNWQSDLFSFKFKNGVGTTLTQFDWVWSCQYGGDYQGVGHYLTNCGATIKKIYAVLSEHVNVTGKGSAPFNYGTHDDPIGGLDLQVIMESNGKFKKTVVGCQITMMGNSTFDIVQCDQH